MFQDFLFEMCRLILVVDCMYKTEWQNYLHEKYIYMTLNNSYVQFHKKVLPCRIMICLYLFKLNWYSIHFTLWLFFKEVRKKEKFKNMFALKLIGTVIFLYMYINTELYVLMKHIKPKDTHEHPYLLIMAERCPLIMQCSLTL